MARRGTELNAGEESPPDRGGRRWLPAGLGELDAAREANQIGDLAVARAELLDATSFGGELRLVLAELGQGETERSLEIAAREEARPAHRTAGGRAGRDAIERPFLAELAQLSLAARRDALPEIAGDARDVGVEGLG